MAGCGKQPPAKVESEGQPEKPSPAVQAKKSFEKMFILLKTKIEKMPPQDSTSLHKPYGGERVLTGNWEGKIRYTSEGPLSYDVVET
jgi:hypothetical protein